MDCPKCKGEMVQGWVPEIYWFSPVFPFGLLVSQWAEGEPQKSWWWGTKRPANQIAIGVFRCRSCGFLETYARDEFKAQQARSG